MIHYPFTRIVTVVIFLTIWISCFSQDPSPLKKKFSVIAYYPWDGGSIDKYPIENLTHIIFGFIHLKGNELSVDKPSDSTIIRHLIDLKKRNPELKVMLSLGGWGGCRYCSQVFSNPQNRNLFVQSALKILKTYSADGLDLDWEFPAIEGYPCFPYSTKDRENFTYLIRELRNAFGVNYELSFAAGGFNEYLSKSVEWDQVMPLVDRVNLMTYDLTNGFSIVTGHHTPLYSSSQQKESVDFGVHFLDSIGVPLNKIAIGAAFYGRVWENVPDKNNGLYQSGKFKTGVNFKDYASYFTSDKGFIYHWDSICMAPTYYSPNLKLFGTFDDIHSVTLKTKYALQQHLEGMMFWELTGDSYSDGLLNAIVKTIQESKN